MAMDVGLTINKLRSNLLKDSRERDQLSRIIKPYGTSNESIHKLYIDDDGTDLLEMLDSPPIAESCMNFSRRIASNLTGTSTKLLSGSHNNTTSSLVAEEAKSEESSIVPLKTRSGSMSTHADRTRSHSILGDGNGLKQKALKTLHKKSSESSLQTIGSRTSEKLKTAKKSGLRLGKLFRSASISSKGSSQKRMNRSTSFAKPLLNFYDHFLYTHEGIDNFEDDDDDDDDKYEYDKGAVLNFFGKEKRNNSGSSLGLDEKVKSAKKSTFLENFPLNPHNILQSSDAVPSAASDKASKELSKQVLHDKDASSYIESYLNQPDLKPIDLQNESVIVHTENNSEELLKSHEHLKNLGFDSSTFLSEDQHSQDDDVSSYGKSLLDSDFSGDEFESSNLQLSDLSSMTYSSQDIPGNSIPRSRALTMYHSGDDSTLDNELDKATKLLHLANKAPREYFSQSVPRDNNITLKKDLNGSQLDLKSSQMKHRSSMSSVSELARTKHLKTLGRHRRTSSSVTQDSIGEDTITDIPEPVLVISKVDVTEEHPQKESKLSALFSKNSSKKLNPLEYFSAASAEKELPNKSVKLDVYIRDSKTYKRKPFTVSVKKSATVFEVLGYCLFCYSTEFKPTDKTGELSPEELLNPNFFTLRIVDEDGEPFEDNFGSLERTQEIGTIFDNEVVICRVANKEQVLRNEEETPLPYSIGNESEKSLSTEKTGIINQLSYYKSIFPPLNADPTDSGSNYITVKVFLYPNLNPQFNFTTIRLPVTSKINDILVRYCKLKNQDPTEYVLKMESKKLILDLNDYVTSLDGNYNLEVLKKKDARSKNFERMKAVINQPALPTIQSSELTPLTLTAGNENRLLDKTLKEEESVESSPSHETSKGTHSKYLLNLTKQNNSSSNASTFFKLKNSSKSSLNSNHKSSKTSKNVKSSDSLTGTSNYKDLLTGAYYKYKVWRRQQMSFINKHERSLVIDGDYVYISGPDGDFNWSHENIKTKSFHVSQITLVKRSKRVPEYFKVFVHRPDRERRYYFEAMSPEECIEIITRLQNLMRVYRMNQKQ